MVDERFEDEPVVGDELVRRFMATEGRTRTKGTRELPLETLVSLTVVGRAHLRHLRFERRSIAEQLHDRSSIAEIAAHRNIPLRAAIIIVSEMVAEGLLDADEVVADVDLPLLHKIRDAIAAL